MKKLYAYQSSGGGIFFSPYEHQVTFGMRNPRYDIEYPDKPEPEKPKRIDEIWVNFYENGNFNVYSTEKDSQVSFKDEITERSVRFVRADK